MNSKHGLSLLKSFQICRPKNPSSMIKTPSSSAGRSKVFDVSFPCFPDPPPSMITPPHSTPFTIHAVSPQETRRASSVERDGLLSSATRLNRPLKRRSGRGAKHYGWRRDENKVNESFVVEKRSVDPYEDFKKSMLEMIVEKHIFGPTELEELFMTFLSLNSRLHHKVIVQAFTQVLNDVFSG